LAEVAFTMTGRQLLPIPLFSEATGASGAPA
jgi:hypothetical protein